MTAKDKLFHNCKKPFLCSCEVEELADKMSDRMMEVVKNHFKKEEKMTAKEMLRKSTKKHRCNGLIGAGSLLEKSIIEAMDDFALHIAEQAVGEVKKENIEADLHDAGWNGACNVILSRIKQLTEND